MINISVCICTRNRQEGLKKLLDSFENLKIHSGVVVRVVIVENDSKSFTENLIRGHSQKSRYKIDYFLEPKRGIVYARNRSVAEAGECDFCCFTDDDQVVTSDWLTELLRCQNEFDADGVAGPTKPFFSRNVPSYIEKFHQPDTYEYGTIVKSAFTGCLLLRKKILDMVDGPFDVRLNFSGGEDSSLTKKVSELGGVLRFNPDAVAFEIIPENRTTIKFIIKRTFRISNARLYINSLDDKNFKKRSVLPRIVMRFCNGLLLLIPFMVFGKADRLKGLIKIVNAIGGFAFIFGKQSQFYK